MSNIVPVTTEIAIANLFSTEKYFANFIVELHLDNSGTNRVAVIDPKGIWDAANSRFLQTKPEYFVNVKVGVTYYLRVAVADKFGNLSAWSSFISLQAGSTTAPTVGYNGSFVLTAAGVRVSSSPRDGNTLTSGLTTTLGSGVWVGLEGTFTIDGTAHALQTATVGADSRAALRLLGTYAASQFAQLKITALDTINAGLGPAVLMSASAETYYGFYINNNSNSAAIIKNVAGTVTFLGAVAGTLAIGDLLEIYTDGLGNIYCLQNGEQLTSAFDTAITSGSPGIVSAILSNYRCSTFTGGDNSARSASVLNYEMFWTTSGTTPPASQAPNLPITNDGTATLHLSAGETANLWIRAVDAFGNKQAWTSLGNSSNGNLDNIDDGTAYQKLLGNMVNLIPDSDLINPTVYWPGNSGTIQYEASYPATPSCPAFFFGPGTGAATSFLFKYSKPIPVVPGATYTLSGFIDANSVTSGTPTWAIFDPTIITNYAQVGQTAGHAGRVSVTFTVPSGVTRVVCVLDTSNCTLASGQFIFWFQPQLVAGSNSGAYVSNSADFLSGTTLIDFNSPAHGNSPSSGSSSSLNPQGGLSNFSAYTFTYTSTSTSITWSWGAFTIYAPDGSSISVAAGSQTAFTGLTASSTYFFGMYYDIGLGKPVVVKSDVSAGKAAESNQQIIQTVNGDTHIPIEVNIMGATPASGSGGGSGGGGGTGTCFSPNTLVNTKRGDVPISSIVSGDFVLTARGTWRPVLGVTEHLYEGTMLDMGDGELSTPGHQVLRDVWQRMDSFSDLVEVEYTGTIHNLHVLTDQDDNGLAADTEHSYTLANGLTVHNFLPS